MVYLNKDEFLKDKLKTTAQGRRRYREQFYDDYLKDNEDKQRVIEFLNTILDDCEKHKKEYKAMREKLWREKKKIIEEEAKAIKQRSDELIEREVKCRAFKITEELQRSEFEASNKYYEKVIEVSDLEQKLKETEKMVDKWKSMFTEQALANAKLINGGADVSTKQG